ncbi:MAG: cell wall biosis glycosyltransferase [Gemmatimonadetes bacterium]|nr:cell wall biosis glycosyltransferase [Gemmatimonadota bacterium]
MKRRHPALFALGLIGLAVVGGLVTSVLLGLDAPPAMREGLIRFTATLLILFMLVLVVRYLSLLWLGYLHHLKDSRDGDADDRSFAPPVSIIVPAYNEGPNIAASLASLLRQDYPRFEVLVVDDGSTDDTYAQASAFAGRQGGAHVRVVGKSNSGKAGALNAGIALARYPFVLCVDGDSRLAADTLRRAVRHLRDPEVAAVAGNVKVANRVNLWTKLQALEYIEGLNMARRAQGFMRAVNIIPGPVGLFRRDVVQRLGGYDTDTFAEDADLTLKILAAGWRVVYEDRAVAWTEAPEDLNSLIKQRYRWTRGILQALLKRGSVLTAPQSFSTWLSVVMMLFESILWPIMNVVGSLFFVAVALAYGASAYLVGWWLLLTVLDVAAALHTVAMEEEDLSLVPLAVVYRFFFILLIDVTKLFATAEEFAKVEMGWGKIERLGRI